MVSSQVLMGIDIGTSGSKGVIVTLDGQIVAEHQTTHGFDIPHPGWAEHDADGVWWHDFCAISRALLEKADIKPGQLAGVGCSAIAPTMLPLDDRGRPLRPAILYGIDARAADEIDEMAASMGVETIFERTGQYLTSQSVGPKVLWFKRHEPELFQRTRKVVTAATYLVYRLTGRYVVDNYVAPYFTPFFDVRKLAWDPELTEPICPVEWLPEALWATEAAGTVTAQAAEETGIPVGTPVSVGTADSSAEAVGSGAVDPGDLMIGYGTTIFMIQALAEYKRHPGLWASVYVIPGQAALAAGLSTSGALLRWFRNQFGQIEQDVEYKLGINAYKLLSDQAADVPAGSNGLVALPYFSGERTPINDPLACGLVIGLTLSHTRGHLYRSFIEGIGYGIRHNIEAMSEVQAVPQRLVAIGGGAADRLWLQACSDITGLRQEVLATTAGAAFGDAYLAGMAAGLFADTATLKDQWVKVTSTVEPNPDHKALYDELYGIYRRLYAQTQDEMHRLSRLQH